MNAIPNLLRPEQILETQSEADRIEGMLNDPRAPVEDRPMATRQLHNMKKMLHEQVPRDYSSDEIDSAVRREKELREHMVSDGMPTQSEMRRSPPGAVHKLRTWEQRNITNLMEWKHIRLRLNTGTSDPDVANFERYRPNGGANEMNLDNPIVTAKDIHLPPRGADLPILMSDEEHAVLKTLDPELADMMALASNEQRRSILEYVRTTMTAKPEVIKPKRKLSPEHLAKLQAGRDKKIANKLGLAG